MAIARALLERRDFKKSDSLSTLRAEKESQEKTAMKQRVLDAVERKRKWWIFYNLSKNVAEAVK